MDAEFKKVMQKNCQISFQEFENFETEEYNKINEKSKQGELKDLESFQQSFKTYLTTLADTVGPTSSLDQQTVFK
jgi:hypothetical protein